MKILLKNAMVLTMNENLDAYETGHVLVEDDKIVNIGSFPVDEAEVDEVYNCEGKIVKIIFYVITDLVLVSTVSCKEYCCRNSLRTLDTLGMIVSDLSAPFCKG